MHRDHKEWFRPAPDLLDFIGAAREDPTLVCASPPPVVTGATPWRHALATRAEDLADKTGVGLMTLGYELGIQQTTRVVESLRTGMPVGVLDVEKLIQLVGCELTVVPRPIVHIVNRLVEWYQEMLVGCAARVDTSNDVSVTTTDVAVAHAVSVLGADGAHACRTQHAWGRIVQDDGQFTEVAHALVSRVKDTGAL